MKTNILYMIIGFLLASVFFLIVGWTTHGYNKPLADKIIEVRLTEPLNIHITTDKNGILLKHAEGFPIIHSGL